MASRRTKVLIVDDEPSARDALERLLSAEGFDVRVASNGRTALALVAEDLPEVIVTDLTMPEMDGLRLLEELRARQIEAPVILATAVNDAAPALAAIRAGAADYLTKPVDADLLLFAIERALRTRDLLRDAATLRARNETLAAEAERNLRAREELLSIVAHDLRGPLSTIMLAAGSRKAADDGRAATRKLGVVQRAARRMARLIEDLLDVSRIETGGLALDLASHRASTLVREVVSMLEPIATESGVRLEMTVRDDFEFACSSERIVQVLVNLASNAINVTGRGRRVRLSAERRGEHAWFAVEDEGPGIEPEHLPRVFERGWHSDSGRRRGAGLGLAIAQGIVEAHGGVLEVESTVGEGSSFHFEMPLSGPERTSWRVVPLASAEPRSVAAGCTGAPAPHATSAKETRA